MQKSSDNLAGQLRQAKTPTIKERLQVLYWLKQEQAPTISAIGFSTRQTSPHCANVVIDISRH